MQSRDPGSQVPQPLDIDLAICGIPATYERMDIETLRTFVQVARRGSFAAVARDRRTDPSSVSRTIASLEDDLRVRLFQRTTKRMTLTEVGTKYFARVAPLLEELDQARDQAVSINVNPIGTIRITASVAFGQKCIAPVLPRLRAAFPDLGIELLLTDANLDLVSDGIDLAIRLGPSRDSALIGTKLFDTKYRVCVSPKYMEECRKNTLRLESPADLRLHKCLLLNLQDYRSRWLFRDAAGTIIPILIHGNVLLSSPLMLFTCAVDGMGPALLANWLADEALATGELIDLFPDYAVSATNFETAAWLLYPSRAYLPIKVRVVIDFLRKELAGVPGVLS